MRENLKRFWVSIAFNLPKERKHSLRLCFVIWLPSWQWTTTDFQRKEDLATIFFHLCLVCSGHPWARGAGQNDDYSGIASDMEVTGHCLPFLCSVESSVPLLFSALLFTLLYCPPSLKYSRYFLTTHHLKTGGCQHLPTLALFSNFKHLDEISAEWVR